jgi:hypothetical protein
MSLIKQLTSAIILNGQSRTHSRSDLVLELLRSLVVYAAIAIRYIVRLWANPRIDI